MSQKTQLSGLVVVGVFVLAAVQSAVLAQAHETYSGSGDDLVDLSKPDEGLPALLVVQGNAAGRHFAVVARDKDGGRIGALVNTTEPYTGFVPVDLPPTTTTTLLEISASGNWQIQVYSIGSSPTVDVPGMFEGDSDSVLWMTGEASRATIQGNPDGSHFAVVAYDGRGARLGAIVNTTDPYSGTVLVPRGTLLLEVTAVGSWQVEVR